MTQKEIIKKYLESTGTWVRAYELRGKSTPYGFAGHQADRRARELAEAGEIEHRIMNGYAEYRAKTQVSEKVRQIISLLHKPEGKVENSNVGMLF